MKTIELHFYLEQDKLRVVRITKKNEKETKAEVLLHFPKPLSLKLKDELFLLLKGILKEEYEKWLGDNDPNDPVLEVLLEE